MNNLRGALQVAALQAVVMSSASSAILVNLDPATALYDSDVKGIVNDLGNGPGTAGNKSGVPLIDDTPTNAYRHALGFTFNIAFTPLAEDLTGTKLLIEIGATSNGSGLYLINGVPTFVGKQGSGDAQVPSSLNDATLPTLALQSSIGKLEAGTSYSLSVSWNHAGTLELKAQPDGGAVVFNSFSISGTPGNWSGNDTLGVKTVGRDNLGGLSGKDSVVGPPFDVDNTSSFAGQVSRALFWNAYSVTALQLTAPVIKGFAVTKAPTAGQVRLHWSATEGGLANPTTIVVKNSANQVVYTAPGLTGFADVASTDTQFTLTATNATGTVTSAAQVEADTSFSSVVLADAPAAWYRFNDATGSSLIVDSAPNATNHDGSVFGAVVSGSTGFIDGAGKFQGVSAITGNSVLNPASFISGAAHNGFSIETIVRRDPAATTNDVILAQTDVNGTGRIVLGVQADGTLYTNLAGGTSRLAGGKLKPGQWSHIVLVVDAAGQQIRWYLDGKAIGTISGVDVVVEASDGNWVIGSAKTLAGNFLNGIVDDVVVYPSLLDDVNKDGDLTDTRIGIHRNAWYAKTSGILYFGSSAASVATGQSATLTVNVGSDVTAVSINNGVGTVPVVDGTATVSVTPTATTTYRVTATRASGDPYTADATVAYQQVTVPVIQGFEATTLPASGKVRLHWAVTAGEVSTPVTVTAKWGASSQSQATTLKGFVDIPAADATNLSLTVTNVIGTATQTATTPAADAAYATAVRADSPVAWFRFNERLNSGLIVDSADNAAPHDGSLIGPVINTGTSGFIDGAATFGGSSGVLSDKIVDLGTVEAGYTVEAIVRNNPDAGTTNRAIVAQQDLVGTGRLILAVDDSGVVNSNMGGGVRKTADNPVAVKTWSHVVLVVDAVNTELRWYVDGVFAGTSKDGTNPDGSTFDPTTLFESSQGAWTIGVHKTLIANFWKGDIDELSIYDKLLDDLNADGDHSDSVVAAHRNAWWSRTTGLLESSLSVGAINPGESTNLNLRVGADVTSVSIDHGVGTVAVVNGRAVTSLKPATTTTYTITLTGSGGTTTQTVTVTVNGTSSGSTPVQVTSTSVSGGNFIISFRGAASTTYAVKGSATLDAFGDSFGTVTTDASGAATVTIPVDATKTRQFFRLEGPQ